jgi:hypothetical protein
MQKKALYNTVVRFDFNAGLQGWQAPWNAIFSVGLAVLDWRA